MTFFNRKKFNSGESYDARAKELIQAKLVNDLGIVNTYNGINDIYKINKNEFLIKVNASSYYPNTGHGNGTQTTFNKIKFSNNLSKILAVTQEGITKVE